MKKSISLLWIALLAFACGKDMEATSVESGETNSSNLYALSADAAVDHLNRILDRIDGADGTRAGSGRRRVQSVRSLKASAIAARTRSDAGAMADVDNLFYIVEFENGQGSAVLGADIRMDPVYAILDQTVLRPEDFIDFNRSDETRAGIGQLTDSLRNADSLRFVGELINMIGSEGLVDINRDSIRNGLLPADPEARRVLPPEFEMAIEEHRHRSPLLKTKWGQGAPYNNKYSMQSTGDRRNSAGCGPIAVAQVLAYFQTDNKLVYAGGRYFNGLLLDECNFGCRPSSAAVEEVANFVCHIGGGMGARPDGNATYTTFESAVKFFRRSGFSAKKADYSLQNIYDMVYLKKYPFFLAGKSAAGSAHAWVIDGWDSYVKRLYITEYDYYDRPLPRRLECEDRYYKVHCNFGWDGSCDGYYPCNIFRTTSRLSDENIDTEYGDVPQAMPTDTYNYDRDFKMIYY